MPILTPRSKAIILEMILNKYAGSTDAYGNSIDTSKGSFTWTHSNVQAEITQGIENKIRFLENQMLFNIFKASRDYLIHWATIFNLTLSGTETNHEIATIIADRLQYPPAGGNLNDWNTWIRNAISDGTFLKTHTNSNNAGGDYFTEAIHRWRVEPGVDQEDDNITVVFASDTIGMPAYSNSKQYATGDIVIGQDYYDMWYFTNSDPDDVIKKQCSPEMLLLITDYLEAIRPLGIYNTNYIGATVVPISININCVGTLSQSQTNTVTTIAENYVRNLGIGEIFERAALISKIYDADIPIVDIVDPATDIAQNYNEILTIQSGGLSIS